MAKNFDYKVGKFLEKRKDDVLNLFNNKKDFTTLMRAIQKKYRKEIKDLSSKSNVKVTEKPAYIWSFFKNGRLKHEDITEELKYIFILLLKRKDYSTLGGVSNDAQKSLNPKIDELLDFVIEFVASFLIFDVETISILLDEFDIPTVEHPDGTKKWLENGVLHRENDLPAILRPDGSKEWWIDGERHRDFDKPAVLTGDGGKQWYKNGVLHRENGLPAVEFPDGSKEWWVDGERHRLDGPAIEWTGSSSKWYINGKRFSEEEFNNYVKQNKLKTFF